MTTLTPEERLEHVDRELEEVKQSFVEALSHVQQSPEVDESFAARIREINARLRELRQGLVAEDYDKHQLAHLYENLFRIRELLEDADGHPDLDTFDQLLIAVERIRHIVRDALDEHVTGIHDDVGLVLRDLKKWLPTTPQAALAELVGVDRRTLSRWAIEPGPPRRRLRTVARVVAVLRHNWEEEGIVAWFKRPRRELGGKRPIALLDDPNSDETLLSAARSGRSQYAS